MDNELANLTLGSSEALVVNGNVKDFRIEGNKVHDTNNIGIDVIGFEGTAPDPDRRPGARRDRARQRGVERRQLREPRLRQRPERRRHLRRRRPRHPGRGQHDPRREHRDRARQRARGSFHQEHHGTQQPGLRLDGDRDRDRRLRPPPGEHRGLRHRQQHRREHRRRRAARAVRHAEQRDREQRHRRRCTATSSSRTTTARTPATSWITTSIPPPTGVPRARGSGGASGTADSIDGARGRGTIATRPSPIPGSRTRRRTTSPLRAGSPAVDAGAFLAASGSTDLRGEPRAQAGGIDLGAFEQTAPPPSPTPSIAGPVTYAGDLAWLQSSNGWGPPEIDRSNGERAPDDGGPIRIGASAFDHGIGAHAPSRIVVELEGRCSLFLADVGLDEEVGDRGSVVFEVWGDGERLAVSGIVRGPQAAVPIAADLQGIGRMSLVVTPGGDGNAFDHADWGDSRLACSG